jgi:transposase
MNSFYNSLITGEDETLIFDITSLSSAYRNIDWLEWGYNRDGLDLPQVNLGLVLSLHRHLPLYFKLFPGSISDVVTLKNLVAEVKALGISKSLFILDHGFYSENNIKEMSDANIDFIIPLPFSVNVGKGLISETNREIESPANAKRFGGDIFYVLESEIQIGDVDAYGYVLFNKKREGLETNSFYNRSIDIECAIDGKEFRNPVDQFKRTAGNFERYFEYTLEGKTIHLSLYRERDEVEKKFDDLKNELEVMPLRVQKVETLQGLLFIFFISLILRAILLRRAREAKLLDKSSIEEILMELSKLRAVKVGGKWRLTEVSKKTEDDSGEDGN